METRPDAGAATGSSPASGGRRLVLALGLLLAAGLVVVIVLSTRSPSPKVAGSPSSAGGAAIVQRRDLVETDTESGTLSYANPQTVYNRLSGTITWLPSVGQLIKPGQMLYRVNGRPVALLDGELPAYRALTAKDSAGQDILQLNRDLVQMGFAAGQITIDDTWQAGTTDAVERWQASLGEKQTGKIALGRIVFLPGAQRITQLDTSCGSTGGGSGGGSGSGSGSALTNGCGASEASATVAPPRPEFVDLTASSTTTPTTTTSTTPTTTSMTTTTTPAATTTTTTTTTTATRPTTTTTTSGSGNGKGSGSGRGSGKDSGNTSGSGRGSGSAGTSGSGKGSGGSGKGSGGSGKGSGGSGKGSGGRGSGSGAGSATAIIQTTSTKLVVTVDLDASKQSEARVGEHVTVEMPAGTTVNGRVSAVSSVAQTSSSSGSGSGSGPGNGGGSGSSGSTIPVTVTLSGQHSGAGLDQAAVSVNFAQARARNVLSVPVTALLATAGAGYAVQEAGAPHTLISVTTGLFAAGYVQISGAGVYPGLLVTDSQG